MNFKTNSVVVFGNKFTTASLIEFILINEFKIDLIVVLSEIEANKYDIAGVSKGIEDIATKNNIHIYRANSYNLKCESDVNFFKFKKFGIGICTGWQRLIPDYLIENFEAGIFGWHGSAFRLPNGRGRSPLNWTIRLGLDKIYHTCLQYNSLPDEGKIYEELEILVDESEYIYDLQIKVLQHIKDCCLRLLIDFNNNTIFLRPQNNFASVSLPKLKESDSYLWPKKLHCIDAINIVRSCSYPFSGATLESGDYLIKIWRLESTKEYDLIPGDILKKEGQLYIGFLDGICVTSCYEQII
jgi:methionyl-tRNA formyltransferase